MKPPIKTFFGFSAASFILIVFSIILRSLSKPEINCGSGIGDCLDTGDVFSFLLRLTKWLSVLSIIIAFTLLLFIFPFFRKPAAYKNGMLLFIAIIMLFITLIMFSFGVLNLK